MFYDITTLDNAIRDRENMVNAQSMALFGLLGTLSVTLKMAKWDTKDELAERVMAALERAAAELGPNSNFGPMVADLRQQFDARPI